jgi:hypothetical protein
MFRPIFPSHLIPAIVFTFALVPYARAQDPSAQPVPPVPAVPSVPPAPISDPPRVEPPVFVDIYRDNEDFSQVTIGQHTRKLPARFSVQPGVYPFIAAGKMSFVTHVEVPPRASRLEIVDVTGPYRIVGAIMIPTGLAVAASLWPIGFTCFTADCVRAHFAVWPTLGLVTFFTGIGLLAYARSRDRFGVRVTSTVRAASAGLRLTGIDAGATIGGGALSTAFTF